MADTSKSNVSVAITVESTPGTYEAPSAGSEFIQPLKDGLEVTPAKELLERNNLTGSIGKVNALTGGRSVSAAVPVEFKAGSSEGDAPEYSPLLRSALGSERTYVTKASSEGVNTNTASKIFFADGDAVNFAIGDIVTVKTAANYHTSPITAVDTGAGQNSITLLVADPNGAIADTTDIMAGSSYVPANSGHPSLSVSKWLEGERLEKAVGCKVNSMALNNFASGGLADISFGLNGIDFEHSLTTQSVTASYDTSRPPVIISACVYVDGVAYDVSDVAWSVENTVADKKTTCSESGISSNKITGRTVSGSFNGYKQDDDVDMYTRFRNATSFSLFASAAVPGATGEYTQVCSFYLPNCVISELGEGDQDGLIQNAISFNAGRGDGTEEEIYITYS